MPFSSLRPLRRIVGAALLACLLLAPARPGLAEDTSDRAGSGGRGEAEAATEGLRTLLVDLTRRAQAGDPFLADVAGAPGQPGDKDVPALEEHLADLKRSELEQKTPAADQRAFLRGGWKHHVVGYLVFSRALAFYVAANLLAAADRHEVTLEEAASSVADAVASRQAIAAYFSFVLVQGRYEKLAARWFDHPSFGAFQSAVRTASTPALIARSLGRSYALLVPVVFTLEAGGGAVTNLANLAAELRAGKHGAPTGLLGYLERDPRGFMRDLWSCVGRAFADVDYVELFVSQAAFVAGMGLVSLVPGLGQSGFAQLLAGFCCAELARRFLVAPLRENLVDPLKRDRAAGALVRHARATGLGPRDDATAEAAGSPDAIRADAARFAAAVNGVAEPVRRAFSSSFRDLALAGTARMSNEVTTEADHLLLGSWPVPFSGLFLDESDAALRLEGAVERLAERTEASGRRFLEHLDREVKLLVGTHPWLDHAEASLRRSATPDLDLLVAAKGLAEQACAAAPPATGEARATLARSLILVLGSLLAERALVAAQLGQLDGLLHDARQAAVDHARTVRGDPGVPAARAILDYDVRSARNEARRAKLDSLATTFAARRDQLKARGRRLQALAAGAVPAADRPRLRAALATVEADFPDLATKRARPAQDFDRWFVDLVNASRAKEGDDRRLLALVWGLSAGSGDVYAGDLFSLLQPVADDPEHREKALAAFLRWHQARPSTTPDPFADLARRVTVDQARDVAGSAPAPADLYAGLASATGAAGPGLGPDEQLMRLARRYEQERATLPSLRQRFEDLRADYNTERAALAPPGARP